VLDYLIIQEPHDLKTLPFQILGPLIVIGQAPIVAAPVDLDNQPRRVTAEIDDEPADRLLPSKLQSFESASAQ
jgi:hypothetical protein